MPPETNGVPTLFDDTRDRSSSATETIAQPESAPAAPEQAEASATDASQPTDGHGNAPAATPDEQAPTAPTPVAQAPVAQAPVAQALAAQAATPAGKAAGGSAAPRSHNKEMVEDFATALETYTTETEAAPSEDRVIKGTVVKVTDDFVVVDIGAKSEGMVPIAEVRDHDGNVTMKAGDEIAVMVSTARRKRATPSSRTRRRRGCARGTRSRKRSTKSRPSRAA